MQQLMRDIGWELTPTLMITRWKGGELSFLGGEETLFRHILRADLRHAIWRNAPRLKTREQVTDVAQQGIDYDVTVRLVRSKREKPKNFTQAYIPQIE